MQSVWIAAKMREAQVDADLQSAWTWIKETMLYDKWDRVKVLMLGADRKSLRSYFDEWHLRLQQQSDVKRDAHHQAELEYLKTRHESELQASCKKLSLEIEALHIRYQQELDDVNQVSLLCVCSLKPYSFNPKPWPCTRIPRP